MNFIISFEGNFENVLQSKKKNKIKIHVLMENRGFTINRWDNYHILNLCVNYGRELRSILYFGKNRECPTKEVFINILLHFTAINIIQGINIIKKIESFLSVFFRGP